MTTPQTTTQTHNTPTTRYVGVDVHKETLHFDAHDLFKGRVQNTPKDIAKLLANLLKKNAGKATLHVCCEATGHYTRNLVQACAKREIPVSIVNPARVKKYAEGIGQLAKTDKADAEVIRLFAESVPKKPRPAPPPDATRETLRQLHALRDHLVDERTRFANLLDSLTLPELCRETKTLLRLLDTRVAKLETQIREAKDKAAPEFIALVDALDGIQGVGLLTATQLAALCPELGTLTRRRSASLAGLAPFPKDSGNMRGPRIIKGGRKPLRDALYMAAQSAAYHNDVLKVVYARLRKAGKPHKVAVVAVMRKLFYYANVVAARLRQPPAGAGSVPAIASTPGATTT